MRGIQNSRPMSRAITSMPRWMSIESVPIYIGEGNLTQRAAPDWRGIQCIEAKGATHVHLHVNYDRDDRLAEVKDLLENFSQAQVPDGCNEKTS